MVLPGGAAGWPLWAHAQQTQKIARIGFLIPSGLETPVTREQFDAIRQALAELAYVEGVNIVFERSPVDHRGVRTGGYSNCCKKNLH
jgi:hypothetical protein